jgi:hypothetical protein
MIIVLAAASMLAGCNSSESEKPTVAANSPYTLAQRDALVRQFQPFCLGLNEFEKYVRNCPSVPIIVYQLSGGRQVVGKVFSVNLETGALSVDWSNTTNSCCEDFYPDSSRSVPGKLTEMFPERPPFDFADEGQLSTMSETQLAQYRERERRAMGKYGELESLYDKQPAITMSR